MTDQNKDEYIVVNPPDEVLSAHVVDFNNPPLVSFCIPTKNNEETLENCLKSVAFQDYPNFEIIIIDGYSTDRTLEIAKQYTQNIFFDSIGYGNACQIGFIQARGVIIASIDSDIIIPHNHWLTNALKYFNYSDKVSTVWPVNTSPPGSSATTRLYFKIWKLSVDDRIKKGISYYGGGNSLFKKSCFTAIGGVNPTIHWGADFDWAMQFKNRGYKVVLSADPLYHDTMRTLKEFYRKQFTGAKTFTKTGFGLMGLSTKDILYENFILGTYGMIRGIFFERDPAWFIYPVFLAIRIVAYSTTTVRNLFNRS